MNVQEVQKIINSVMFNEPSYGLKVFAVIKNNESLCLKKFATNDKLCSQLKQMLVDVIKNQYFTEDFEIDSADNISDNKKVFYEITQDDKYSPFSFVDEADSVTDKYFENNQDDLMGLLFKVNLNDNCFWCYQHVYQVRMIKRSKSLYAILSKGDTYAPLDSDVFRIENRVDVLIIGNSIIFKNITLLQQQFGFDKYIRKEAAATIEIISQLDIVSDTTKIIDFEDKQKLTNAKKLLKAKSSPVLKMKKQDLISGLKSHPRYRGKFEFEGDKILIKTQKDVGELIKMLNDDIVRSDLTNQEYDSSTKSMLLPLETE